MKQNPLFSIITPTKNRASTIAKSINSVLSQTFDNWEHIVVDANSNDGTREVVSSVNDKRIRFVNNINDNGPSSGRNQGIEEAQGEFIGYLDSDDLVYPNWLETMYEYIQREPTKVLFMPNKRYEMNLLNNDGSLNKTFVDTTIYENADFSYENVISLSIQCDTNGMIHKKTIVDEIGGWNTSLKLYEDFEFLLRVAERYPQGFQYVPEILVKYTRSYGKDSLCSKATYQQIIDSIDIVHNLHGHKKFLKNQKWHSEIRKKYINRAKAERQGGKKIIDYILEKYTK